MNRFAPLFFLSLILLMMMGQAIYAQAPVQVPNAAPIQTPVNGGGSIIIRPLWTEIFITVVMFGLALFAVGRSSNRS